MFKIKIFDNDNYFCYGLKKIIYENFTSKNFYEIFYKNGITVSDVEIIFLNFNYALTYGFYSDIKTRAMNPIYIFLYDYDDEITEIKKFENKNEMIIKKDTRCEDIILYLEQSIYANFNNNATYRL